MEKNWYNWTISKAMWKMVRPFIKLLQDESDFGNGYDYHISECYAKLCLSMYLNHTEFIKMDTALRNVADALEEFEEGFEDKVLRR